MKARGALLPMMTVIAACSSSGTPQPDAASPDHPVIVVDAAPDRSPSPDAGRPDARPDTRAPDAIRPDALRSEAGGPVVFGGVGAAYPCDASVVLRWRPATAVAAPVTYQVFVATSAGGFAWNNPELTTSETRAEVSGLTAGTTYYFAVRAVDKTGATDGNTASITATPAVRYPTLPFKELVFPAGPAFPYNHSSSLVELPGGELFVVWYSGDSEHAINVAVWGSRRKVGAGWTAPSIVHDTPGVPDGNSILFYHFDTDKLWLFHAVQVNSNWSTAELRFKTSGDLGASWTASAPFGTGPGVLPRTHAITLASGAIVLPLYVESLASSVVVRSIDSGKSWTAPSTILLAFGTQPTVIQRTDGSLFALMRSGSWPNKSWQARSTDEGATWKDAALSSLNNPGSSVEMIKLRDGKVVVAFNNATDNRRNLSLARSLDDGASWLNIKAVEDDPVHGHSYPSLVQDECGLIHLTYSYADATSIAHVVVDESWIATP